MRCDLKAVQGKCSLAEGDLDQPVDIAASDASCRVPTQAACQQEAGCLADILWEDNAFRVKEQNGAVTEREANTWLIFIISGSQNTTLTSVAPEQTKFCFIFSRAL